MVPFRADIKFDSREIEQALQALGAKAPIAMARTLNRTADAVRTEATRQMATDLGLPQNQIRDKLFIVRATPQDLLAEVRVSEKKRIPLLSFSARQTSRGVAYRLSGGRSEVPSAFIASMRSGHRGVFKRRSRSRLPIRELFGPSLQRVFTRAKIVGAMKQKAITELAKNLVHEVRFILSRPAA